MFVPSGDLAWEAERATEITVPARPLLRRRNQGRPNVRTVELAGVQLHAVTEADCVKLILDELDAGRGGVVVTPNLDHLRRCRSDLAFSALVAEADLKIADGMPLVWASRFQGTPLPERVAGSDLISSLSSGAAQRGRSIFLMGGDPGTAESAAVVLRQRYPQLKIAGHHYPPFGFDKHDEEIEKIEQVISAASPDIIFVALGSPKQELLIERIQKICPNAWWLGVGNSFSFLSGNVRRAPLWMQKKGLEWVHRLGQEPRKLFKRYIVFGVPFATRLLGGSFLRGIPRRLKSGQTADNEIVAPDKSVQIEKAIRSIVDERPIQRPIRRVRSFPLQKLRALVLLGGAVRPNRLRQSIGRSVLDLPLDETTTLLGHWMHHAEDLADFCASTNLPVRLLVDNRSTEPVSGAPFHLRLRIEHDVGEYRGTGGVLRDIATDYDDDDLILVGNAAQIVPGELHQIVAAMSEKGGDVTLVSHADGTPSGLMLLRCQVLSMIPKTGFVDMKEQALPRIADDYDVRVLRMHRASGFPVRSLDEYIRALKTFHRLRTGMAVLTDPLAEDWRSTFNVIEPGAKIGTGARLFDSVIFRDAVLEPGSVVVRSVVCSGAILHRDRSVVDEFLKPAAEGRK